MKDKSQIINSIIKEVDAKSYLEVGYGNGVNFKKISCDSKTAIEPNWTLKSPEIHIKTSDEFFSANKDKFDCIFIDGLHHSDQVQRDILNSLKCKPKVIFLHDTLPPTKEHQIVPRKQLSWTGDVWRAVVGFIKNHPKERVETYRADYGLTVIYPSSKRYKKNFVDTEMTFEYFDTNKIELLNIID